MKIELNLPWPPSVNRYWRSYQGKTLLSCEGREYRELVYWAVKHQVGVGLQPLSGPLRLTMTAHPPDHRRRDLDNLCKAVLDGLEHAGLYEDDSQIDDLRVIRGRLSDRGDIEVEVDRLLS